MRKQTGNRQSYYRKKANSQGHLKKGRMLTLLPTGGLREKAIRDWTERINPIPGSGPTKKKKERLGSSAGRIGISRGLKSGG